MQGFASGDLERDATAVRMFTDAGVELLLSQVGVLSCLQLAMADHLYIATTAALLSHLQGDHNFIAYTHEPCFTQCFLVALQNA